MKKTSLLITTILILFISANAQTNNIKWITIDELKTPIIGGQWMPETQNNRMGRLPDSLKPKVREKVWELSQQNAGEYIEFYTNSNSIYTSFSLAGALNLPNLSTTSASAPDLYQKTKDGQWLWTAGRFNGLAKATMNFENLNHQKGTRYRLYLPTYNALSHLKIGIDSNSYFDIVPQNIQNPIIVYGTSIAQGASASRAGLAWTSLIGRKLDTDIINLGFSGNGRFEKPILDFILQKPSRLIILDCLPNMTLKTKGIDRQKLFDTIVNSVQYLRKRALETPIIITQHSGGADTAFSIKQSNNEEFLTASQIADSAVQYLKKLGVKQIYQIKAVEFNLDSDCTIDGVHPNDYGMQKIAHTYEKHIRNILHLPQGDTRTSKAIQQFREYPGYDWLQRHQAVLAYNQQNKPKLIILGNSIMHYWAGNPSATHQRGLTSWAKYIAPFEAVNLGFGWDRIENMLWRVQNGELDGYTAKKIFVMAGTNNLSIGDTDELIIKGLNSLINEIKYRQPQAEIIVSGIFPRRDYELRIQTLNPKIQHLSQELNVQYVDFSNIFILKNGCLNESLFSDGLHPNTKGYEALGKEMYHYLGHQ